MNVLELKLPSLKNGQIFFYDIISYVCTCIFVHMVIYARISYLVRLISENKTLPVTSKIQIYEPIYIENAAVFMKKTVS